jgi:transposase
MSRDTKYIGMDVHKEAIVIAILNDSGKLVMESIVETQASSILQFIHGLRGELHVTWEEGTWAAWLYDLLKPHVHEVLVCNPRRNALLKEGSKSDKVDARKLADLLRTGMLRPVYHGENGLRTLRELARSYQTISKDLNRVMNRLKALYRGWGIACSGTQVYAARYREEWLHKIPHAGVHRRAELLYIDSAASDSCGPTVAWALRRTTVRNTAMSVDNCNARKNHNRFVVSIRITTTR